MFEKLLKRIKTAGPRRLCEKDAAEFPHFELILRLPQMNFLLLLVSAAYAHYQLTVPKTRGNEDAFQLDAPCAGYQKGPAVATALKSKVTVISGHEGSISYYISKTDNPKSQADFVLIKGNVSVPSVGSFSTEVDFSMPPASLVDKSTAVIQTVFDGPGKS